MVDILYNEDQWVTTSNAENFKAVMIIDPPPRGALTNLTIPHSRFSLII